MEFKTGRRQRWIRGEGLGKNMSTCPTEVVMNESSSGDTSTT